MSYAGKVAGAHIVGVTLGGASHIGITQQGRRAGAYGT